MPRIKCTFVPQAWVRDNAIEVDPDGPTEWETHVDSLPKANSHESDDLRYTPEAPQWVREWHGPFEVDYEEIEDGSV